MCKLSDVRMSMGSSFHHLGARTANSRDFDECLALSEGATSRLADYNVFGELQLPLKVHQ